MILHQSSNRTQHDKRCLGVYTPWCVDANPSQMLQHLSVSQRCSQEFRTDQSSFQNSVTDSEYTLQRRQFQEHVSCGFPSFATLVPVCKLGRTKFASQDSISGLAGGIPNVGADMSPETIDSLRAGFYTQLATLRKLHAVHLREMGLDPSDLMWGELSFCEIS